MSHYASKCVECNDLSKKCIKMRLKDEKGKVYYELMYECNNNDCNISRISHKMERKNGTKRRVEL